MTCSCMFGWPAYRYVLLPDAPSHAAQATHVSAVAQYYHTGQEKRSQRALHVFIRGKDGRVSALRGDILLRPSVLLRTNTARRHYRELQESFKHPRGMGLHGSEDGRRGSCALRFEREKESGLHNLKVNFLLHQVYPCLRCLLRN